MELNLLSLMARIKKLCHIYIKLITCNLYKETYNLNNYSYLIYH